MTVKLVLSYQYATYERFFQNEEEAYNNLAELIIWLGTPKSFIIKTMS